VAFATNSFFIFGNHKMREYIESEHISYLLKLLNSEHDYFREIVAKDDFCPKEFLEKLSTDRSRTVRMNVACNPNCPIDILEKLFNEDYFFKQSIVSNKNCPIDILNKAFNFCLENSDNNELKYYLISNINCPTNILENFVYDDSKYIEISCLKHKNIPISILEEEANNIINDLSNSNSNEGEDLLTAILLNENCTENIFKKVINNPKLLKMTTVIVENDNCPFRILKEIYKKFTVYSDSKYNDSFLKNIIKHPNWKVADFK